MCFYLCGQRAAFVMLFGFFFLVGWLFLRKLLQMVFAHCCNWARVKFGDRLASWDFGICVKPVPLAYVITSVLGLLKTNCTQLVSVVWWCLQQVAQRKTYSMHYWYLELSSRAAWRVWWCWELRAKRGRADLSCSKKKSGLRERKLPP